MYNYLILDYRYKFGNHQSTDGRSLKPRIKRRSIEAEKRPSTDLEGPLEKGKCSKRGQSWGEKTKQKKPRRKWCYRK